MNKITTKILFSLLILTTAFAGGIENSIVASLENSLILENLPVQKYSKNQFSEIVTALQHSQERLRIVTFNMLINKRDYKTEESYRWPQRLPRIVEIIEELAPDVIGAQELYQSQLDDLLAHIGPNYGFFGEPRTDGELNGVFYRKSRLELVGSEVWTIPGIGNNVTMVQLHDLVTGQLFAIFNTHASFSGPNDRDEEIQFILKQIHQVAEKMPVIFTGDFNTFPNRLNFNSLPFYDGDYIHRLLTKKVFKDSSDLSLLGHLGPISTYTNVPDDKKDFPTPFQGTGTPGVMLDHIYVSKEITVLTHAVQPGTVNGYFPSDHMPVIIDCLINNE
jgi:endonuclease/exonuclease/phosphatase family metal-dependent hydrolase